MKQPKDYDTTIARIAGNIAAGLVTDPEFRDGGQIVSASVVATAVTLAYRIVTRIRVIEAEEGLAAGIERARQDERRKA